MSLLSKVFGSSGEQEESSADEPNMSGACNEAGHYYGDHHRTSLITRTSTFGKGDVQIKLKRWYRCEKCDKLRTEKEVIASLDVDRETGEVTQI